MNYSLCVPTSSSVGKISFLRPCALIVMPVFLGLVIFLDATEGVPPTVLTKLVKGFYRKTLIFFPVGFIEPRLSELLDPTASWSFVLLGLLTTPKSLFSCFGFLLSSIPPSIYSFD